MNTTDLRYLAAIIDAEGCIATPRQYRTYGVQLSAVNTFRPVLELLQSSLAAGEIVCPHPATEKRQACYTWRCINAPATAHALRALLPYLIIKRVSAIHALALADRIAARSGRVQHRLTAAEIEVRADLVTQIRASRYDWPEPNAIQLSWAYVAGCFDGEGTIAILSRQQYRSPILHLAISNNCLPLLEAIRNHTNWGMIRVVDRPEYRLPVGGWYLTGASRVQRFLLRVLPHLQIKRQQAIIALDLLDRIISRTGRPGQRLLSSEIEHRVALAQQIRALKHTQQKRNGEEQ